MYPVLFEVFGFPISSFGVMVALGFLLGGRVAERFFTERGIEGDLAWRIVIYCMVGGILGSKIWYAAEQVARGADGTFVEYAFLTRGGMTWYGGLAGGAAAGIIGAMRAKVPLLTVLNATGPTLLLGQAIGRIGCFLVGDDYGHKTDVAWAIAFPNGLPPTTDAVHPTQLYEAGWLGLAFWITWRRRARSNALFAEYLMLAGAGRFVIEFFRTNPAAVGSFTNAQVVAGACVAVGAGAWLWLREPSAAERTPTAS